MLYSKKKKNHLLVVELQSKRRIVHVFDSHCLFSRKLLVRRVYDRILALLEWRILDINAEEEKMRKINHVDRTNASLSKEIRPIFLCVLVVYSVFEVIWQKILQFDGRCEFDPAYRDIH